MKLKKSIKTLLPGIGRWPIIIAIRLIFKSIVYAIYIVPAFFLKSLGFCFPNFYVSRIGHLLAEPDCYIKETKLNLMPKRKTVMLAAKNEIANHAVIEYWEKYFIIIKSPVLVKFLSPLSLPYLCGFDASKYCVTINDTADYYRIQALWDRFPPLLSLTAEHARRGRMALARIGVLSDNWFFCVHFRDGGYSPDDEDVHSFRNCNIDEYLLAIRHLISLGGIGVVMGDPTMGPIPMMENLVDYAHHPSRCDWLDLYISASCRFFLGNTSGAFLMSSVFGVPVACASMVPFSAVFPGSSKDIGIPKLYRDISTNRLIPFREILDSPMGNFRSTREFEIAGIQLVNNSAEEVRDLAIELYEITSDSKYIYDTEDDVLQLRFKSLFKSGHYSYGSTSRVGRSFLKKYQFLLP